MELRQLKYFVAVARTLSFSEASRRLYITQGTLSQQIRQLEDELGSQLFERTSRSVILTEAGMELLPLAVDTIEASDACTDKMSELRGALSGTLRIGTTDSFSGLVAETVKQFMKLYRGVDIAISCKPAAELADMLRNHEIDLALAFRSVVEYEEFESEELFTTSLSAVMRKDHPLADRPGLTLSDLRNQELALPGRGLQARNDIDRFVSIDTRGLNVKVEVDDLNLMMDLVQDTGMVALMSPMTSRYRDKLTAIALEGGRYTMEGCVHRMRRGYRKRTAELFTEMLRDNARIERIYMEMDKI